MLTEYSKDIPVTTTIHIDREILVDLLSLMGDGGIGYWGDLSATTETVYQCAKANLKQEGLTDVCYEDILAEILISGGKLDILDQEEEKHHTFTLAQFEKAVSAACEEFGTYMDMWDGDTGDYIGQYLCFGEIIYG